MKWTDLLALVGEQPVFESAMLFGGEAPPAEVRRQLTRWTAAGRLVQLRRGLYAFAPLHAKVRPHPFTVAARLRRPSYISLQSALAFHGLIPESVPVVTNVTTGRPGEVVTPLGRFSYRHVRVGLFWGYAEARLEGSQAAFVAAPEKALLDLIHLTPGPVTEAFLDELRLDPTGTIDPSRLRGIAERMGGRKIKTASERVTRWLRSTRKGHKAL